MTDISANNKRIVKNTLFLYFRTLLIMLIALYTSRVVLNALGVEDYGIYNVVGGVVAMFSMLSGSLSAAITRFITYELGRGSEEKLNKIFSSSLTIQIGLSLIIVLLAETLGLWFLNEKLNIPASRLSAANWVFQWSVLTFAINLLSVPYNACIIAHERMAAFAYMGLLEAAGKLCVAYLIGVSPIDRLVFYAVLMCAVAVIVRIAYGVYCKRHFPECVYHWGIEKGLMKKMGGFAGWNFIGSASSILRDQGGNVVINLFCGPAVNAARGIAFQVNAAVQGFVQNFVTALNPQITKSYAAGNRDYMMTLIFQGGRLSFYMLLLLSLPVLINTHYILLLWLKNVPEHTVAFVQLVLMFGMSEIISQPLITAMLATGKIRNYQLIVGGLQTINLPLSYWLLQVGFQPECVFIVAIFISQCCLAARLWLLSGMIGLSVRAYLQKVYLNVIVVALVSSILPIWLVSNIEETFPHFVLSSLFSVLYTSIVVYYIGCSRKERQYAVSIICKIKNRLQTK